MEWTEQKKKDEEERYRHNNHQTLTSTFQMFKCSSETNPAVAALDSYLEIGAALSQDQHSEALKHTKDLNNAVSNINNEKAKAALTPIIEQLSKTKDLDSARKSYEQLSSKLNAAKKDLGVQADEYYCPMVKKTWLQKDSKITNPYAGKDMASCDEKKS